MTTAQWMRTFVTKHPDYKQDSVVNERISYDLLKACDEISNKGRECPELFGKPETRTSNTLKPGCLQMMNEGVTHQTQAEINTKA